MDRPAGRHAGTVAALHGAALHRGEDTRLGPDAAECELLSALHRRFPSSGHVIRLVLRCGRGLSQRSRTRCLSLRRRELQALVPKSSAAQCPSLRQGTQPRCHSSRRAALWDRDDPPLGRSAPGRCPTSRLGNSPRLGLENFGVAVPNGIALHEGPPGAAIRADHPDVAALSSTALHRGAADSSKPATRCRSEQPAALPFIEAAWCRWPGAGP